MALEIGNWVKENCSTTGNIDDITLAGSDSSYATFQDVIPDGSDVNYTIHDGGNRETGTGVFTAPITITRANVIATLENDVYNDTPTPGKITLSGNSVVTCSVTKTIIDSKADIDHTHPPAVSAPETVAVDTILTSSSSAYQIATAPCRIELPDATTMSPGNMIFQIQNSSTGIVTVWDAWWYVKHTIAPGDTVLLNLEDDSNSGGVWSKVIRNSLALGIGEEDSLPATADISIDTYNAVRMDQYKTMIVYALTGSQYITAVGYNPTEKILGTPVTLDGTNYGVYPVVSSASTSKAIVGYSGYLGAIRYCAMNMNVDTITSGTPVNGGSNWTDSDGVVAMSSNTAVGYYCDRNNSNLLTLQALSIDGSLAITTTTHVATTITHNTSGIEPVSVWINSSYAVMFFVDSSSDGYVMIVNLSGTTVTYGTPVLVKTGTISSTSIGVLDSGSVAISYKDAANSNKGFLHIVDIPGGIGSAPIVQTGVEVFEGGVVNKISMDTMLDIDDTYTTSQVLLAHIPVVDTDNNVELYDVTDGVTPVLVASDALNPTGSISAPRVVANLKEHASIMYDDWEDGNDGVTRHVYTTVEP